MLGSGQNLPGPYATFLLAGWGAVAIEVEPPRGDPGRFMQPFFSMRSVPPAGPDHERSESSNRPLCPPGETQSRLWPRTSPNEDEFVN